jgi:hypothetical protein
MKKEAIQKMQRGSFERPVMKKEATSKNAKGLIRKTSDEKRGIPKITQRGSFERPPIKKRCNPKKCKRARSEDLR